MVHALGMGDQLVLRSHECDHPPGVEALPFATAPRVMADGADGKPSGEIDRGVRWLLEQGLSIYELDAERLRAAAPDLILTQHQCQVCAVPFSEIEAAARELLDPAPRIVSLSPRTLDDVLQDHQTVADALGVPERGAALVASLRARMESVRVQATGAAAERSRAGLHPRPRVLTIEWLDPLMAGGNWMPELVAMAGGENLLGSAGAHSPFLPWERFLETDPDVIVVVPCGFSLARTLEEMPSLASRPGWGAFRAVQEGRVAVVDGHHYFNRPGPRMADSLEILFEILHPEAGPARYAGEGWVWWTDRRSPSFASRVDAR